MVCPSSSQWCVPPSHPCISTLFQVVEQIATGEPLPEAAAALRSCGHPEELCGLASKTGLLNPDPAKRCTLEQVLERYPLEEPWDGGSDGVPISPC